MENLKIFYRRHLPHYQPAGVLLNLREEYGLNKNKISDIKDEKEKRSKYEELKLHHFDKFDTYLWKYQNNIDWLKNPAIANIVKGAIHFRDKTDYNLFAYSIMPNHVHLVFTLIEKDTVGRADMLDQSEKDRTVGEQTCSPYRVTKILKSLKWYTGVECNKILHRSGSFWQHESYDHIIRNEDELLRIVEYVLLNPVKAGLIDKWEDWEWNYINL